MPSSLEDREEKGEVESLPKGPVQILFYSILENATISGNQLCEVFSFSFPMKKLHIDSLSKSTSNPIIIKSIIFPYLPPPTHTNTPFPFFIHIITIIDYPPV